MDTRVSRDTRVEVVTEGVLTRLLQSDPSLEGVAALVFDEFHERSLQADVGLALALDARENLTPDLKIVAMSATLDGAAVAQLLGDAPVVTAEGRAYPVESRFIGKGAPVLPEAGYGRGVADSPEGAVVQAVRRALREEQGDILVFLPGAREIRRVQSVLESGGPGSGAAGFDPAGSDGGGSEGAARKVRVLPLFGELSAEDQDAALSPAGSAMRKVVLATNIAETSLTIPGVRVVIDSGLVRRSLFDPATGMSRLETQRISRASAEQRQGRAGRTEPGVCYRLWSEGAHRSLAPFTPPEIAEADLAPLALDLASWGTRDAAELRWLDPPPAPMLASARDLLRQLGALDSADRITRHGREMARLSVHPRLAHMLLRAAELHSLQSAADLAALLSERDLLRGVAARDADMRSRLELMRGETSAQGADRVSLQRARRASKELVRQIGAAERNATAESNPAGEPNATVDVGTLLAFAYPDRVGRRRPGGEGRYTLANGRGAHFAEAQGLSTQEFVVAVDLDDRDRDARIVLAAPLSKAQIEAHLADRLERGASVEWSSRDQAVIAQRFVRLGAVILEEKPLADVPAGAAQAAMLVGIRAMGLDALPWTREARDLQARIEFARRADPSGQWPAVSDEELAAALESWLPAWLEGVTRRAHLARLSMAGILRSRLSWEQQRLLDELAPTHLQVPSGSRISIDYQDPGAPAVSVRLQEVFGLQSTPHIGGGRVPVTFKLLSPAHRPVQVTRDLAGFWRGSYAEVRKDMRGRYPRHDWPEDPLTAVPRRAVRRR
ncbi:MAG TPA: ATP-dependent helicase HrpB, partial [Steroidobacteraceae bacterium]|nr:ATP-dependent helicase HrpB [Steroidobacteraceae bacterium]